jgi:hypothetical protein
MKFDFLDTKAIEYGRLDTTYTISLPSAALSKALKA